MHDSAPVDTPITTARDIVYAQPGGGARFAPSIEVAGRAPAVEGLPAGAIFPQRRSRFDWFMGDLPARHPHHEHAFTLNVWAPEDAAGAPVLIFLHGGAWVTGGGALEWYDGSVLARHGLVVVAVNYRIGPLAHLVDPATLRREEGRSRDVAIDDLLAALNWVQSHVAEYGGDPRRVTLAGQSAGAWYAHALSLMPEAAGLFRRVALLSLPGREPWSVERQAEVSERASGLLAEQGWAGTLTEAPIEALLDAGLAAVRPEPAFGPPAAGYLPVREPRTPKGLFEPTSAVRQLHVEAAYLRYTADEAAVFLGEAERSATWAQVRRWLSTVPVDETPPQSSTHGAEPFDALVEAASWRTYIRPTTRLADAYAASGIPTVLRRFDPASPQPWVRSGHCYDLPFQFGNRDGWRGAAMLSGLDERLFAEISDQTVADLVAFVAAGDLAGAPALHTPGAAPIGLGSIDHKEF